MPRPSGFAPVDPALEDNPTRRISSVDPKLSRTNYFDGRLLRASDLIRDQLYLDERLREVGRVLGHGVVRGFAINLNPNGVLSVSGGVAVAPSGRVLELNLDSSNPDDSESVTLNLFDTAQIKSLNPDMLDRFETGLYVVAVRNAQRGDGAAEVFPADLEGERGFRFNVLQEGVELLLVPIRTRLTNTTRNTRDGRLVRRSRFVTQRAALVPQLLSNQGQPPELGDGSVALGLLAMENGQPIWLDEGLVRRSHRAPGERNQLQQDLFTHYDKLLDDVLEDRGALGRAGGFRAQSYFQLLPPAGRMPVDSIDPENGLQSFFPAHFDVDIAPVRSDDLPALLDEAAALDPIDLSSRDPAEIIILAPLSDLDFSRFARLLEFDPKAFSEREAAYREAKEALDAALDDDADVGDAELASLRQALEDYERYFAAKAGYVPDRLPSLDSLSLRLRQVGTAQALDTDSTVWRSIQSLVSETGTVWFMRRPPRTAETGVSAIVLARGYTPPEPGDEPGADTEELEEALDEATDQLAQANENIVRLEAEIAVLQDEINTGDDAELAAALTRIAELSGELAAAQETALLVPGLQRQLLQLQALLAAAQARIAELEAASGDDSEAEELRARILDLTRRLANAETTIRRLSNELEGEEIKFDEIVVSRRITDESARAAAAELAEIIRDKQSLKKQVVSILSRVPDGFEAALWPTLFELLERDAFAEFINALRTASPGASFGSEIAEALQRLGVSNAVAALWKSEDRGPIIERPIDFDNLPILSAVNLAESRNITDPETLRAVEKVDQAINNDRAILEQVNFAAALIPGRYDTVLWSMLSHVIANGRLEQFVKIANQANQSNASIGLAMAANAQRLSLNAELRNSWTTLDLEES